MATESGGGRGSESGQSRRSTLASSTKATSVTDEVAESGRVSRGGARRRHHLQQQSEEIESLQRAKQLEIDMTGDPIWREQLRRELEAEISRRVREALDTPPAERQRRSRDLARLKAAAQREQELTQLRLAAASMAERASAAGLLHHHQQHQMQQHTRFYGNQQMLRREAQPDHLDAGGGGGVGGFRPAATTTSGSVRERFYGNHHGLIPTQYLLVDDRDSPDDGEADEEAGDEDELDFVALPRIPLSRQLTTDHHLQQQQQQVAPSSTLLRRGLEAMRHFGELSPEERQLLFSNFTRDAFRQAVTGGSEARLPDGSVLTPQPDGRFRDQYGILRDRHGPFWPCDFGPCHPAPRHRRLPSPELEPLLLPMKNPGRGASLSTGPHVGKLPSLRCKGCEPLVTAETQRTEFTGRWRGTQIVFDSERCPRHYSPPSVADDVCPSLMFESRFECGNLRQARRVGMFEYELVLRTDLYTKRHTQWFYFRVQNAQPGIVYKLVIVNLLKPTSLYGEGMKPLVYSERAAAAGSLGWHRTGHHIRYTRNVTRLQSMLLHREMAYYQLEWQMEFPQADDCCYLAHCYPYTYSDMTDDLMAIQKDERRRRLVKQEVLCETRAGNSCFLLTVTEPSDEQVGGSSGKRGVMVTARVHPGEANSSWMMKGLIDFLTGDSPTAAALRRNFVFKLVPMLNPDGVIVGNYRTSLAARDLNRNYRHPRPEAFPTVFHTKRMLERLQQERPVVLYCDLHGHSRKSNVFMYGCDSQYRGVDLDQVNSLKLRLSPDGFLNERLFPWLVSRCSPGLFSYRGCKFNIRKCKEATGRVVMWRQFGIENSFTMEATFSGTSAAASDSRHFNTKDLESMGHSLGSALWEYKQVKDDPARQSQIVVDMTFDLVMGLVRDKGEATVISSCAKPTQSDLGVDSSASKESLVEILRSAMHKSDPNSRFPTRGRDLNAGKVMEQLSLRSVEDCSSLLKQLNIDSLAESDSSDSDSESDPELPAPPPRPEVNQTAKRRKRKLRKKDASGGKKREAREAADNAGESESNGICDDQATCDKVAAKTEVSASCDETGMMANSRAKIKQYPMFVSKFEGRTNNGIPCFSQERLLERANRKIFNLHTRLNQESGRDIIYSISKTWIVNIRTLKPRDNEDHVEDMARDTKASLTSLDEIRYRLQHLLAIQDVQEGENTASDTEDPVQRLQNPPVSLQPPAIAGRQLPPNHFTVIRPAPAVRPAARALMQRRRSMSHFSRTPVPVSLPTVASAPSLDHSLPTQLFQQPPALQPQPGNSADSLLSAAGPHDQSAATAASTHAGSSRNNRSLRLPQLRERHNRMP